MKRILITAYDVNPYKGSESATGWNYAYNISKTCEVTLVTRKNNIENIRRYIDETSIKTDNLIYKGVDLPKWARFWKRGVRGSFLYSYLWQILVAISFYRKRSYFDIVHALNFHCDWCPSFLWLLGKPFIWGPINHNEKLPKCIFYESKYFNFTKEAVKFSIKSLFWKFDPFLYLCKNKADIILIGHENVRKRLNLLPEKTVLFNQIATYLPFERNNDGIKRSSYNVLAIGRGLPIKNHQLVLESFYKFISIKDNNCPEDTKLFFVGVGKKSKNYLEKRAEQLQISELVVVHEWVHFESVSDFYNNADVLCFPSFEGAGMVIAEALSFGLPVITVKRNGASHLLEDSCAFVLDGCCPGILEEQVSHSLLMLFENKTLRDKMSSSAFQFCKKHLTWEVKSKIITELYQKLECS